MAISGTLDCRMGGPPVAIEPRSDGRVVVPESAAGRWRRSLYLFARRNYNLTLLSVFDQPVIAINCTRRIHSAVPLQSLTLLNDELVVEQAQHFARRVAAASSSRLGRIETAFQLALGRLPSSKEKSASLAFLSRLEGLAHGEQAEREALTRLCHMLLCCNELLYLG
jgi:hypothetical protein